MKKPHAPACDRNQEAILKVLQKEIRTTDKLLLEVGAGTGQHAVHMAHHFPHLQWVLSDLAANHLGIRLWLKETNAKNIEGPIRLQIGVDDFPKNRRFQAIFTANTLHVMSWKKVKTFIKLLGGRLQENARVFFYGPFNYEGKFTSQGNEKLNQWLKEQNQESAIRNFEDVHKAMVKAGFVLHKDHEMPANNRMLVFQRLKHQRT